MKLSSLLISSAAFATFASSAYAADAIVIAEPEPVEFVRVCDVYGAGFFFIPGTQNCLRIGGYMRYEAHYDNTRWADTRRNSVTGQNETTERDYRYGNYARFQLNVDARNETEWGTLRGYAEARFNWNSTQGAVSRIGGATGAALHQGYIELQSGAGTLRLGKTDTAYTRFLGYGLPHGPFDGSYAYNNAGELSYHYDAGNGFSAIIAAVELNSASAVTDANAIARNNANGVRNHALGGQFKPGIEGGVRFAQGWGSVGALVGYDTRSQNWGVKGMVEGNLGVFNLGVKAFYASADGHNNWTFRNFKDNVYSVDGRSEFSVMGYGTVALTDTLSAILGVQYFDNKHERKFDQIDVASANAAANPYKEQWELTAGLDWRPVAGLRVRPEVSFKTKARDGHVLNATVAERNETRDSWRAAIRFDRSF